MNRVKLVARKMDLQRRGQDPRDLDPELGKAPLRVHWPKHLERLVSTANPYDLRNATKRPISKVDRHLRRTVSRLHWKLTLLPGRVP